MSTHEPKENKSPANGGGNGKLSRRDFLLKFSIGLNVLAGAMVSLPLIGYVMSSFVKRLPLEVDRRSAAWTSFRKEQRAS